MPRDPQGAGTRTETRVEWRNVYADAPYHDKRWTTRELADEFARPDRIAIERIETTTTITREPIAPHAGEETKG